MADTILSAIRGVIDQAPAGAFPVGAINARLAELNRAVRFADDEIDTLLEMDYGDRRIFLLLSLLYACCPEPRGFSHRLRRRP